MGRSSVTRLVKASRTSLNDTVMSATTISVPSGFGVRWRIFSALAQRHEFRIALDVGDQIEHLRRGVMNPALAGKFRHRLTL